MYKVVLGAHSIRKKEKDSKQIQKVEKLFPHPNYTHVTKGNDLMLVKVRR